MDRQIFYPNEVLLDSDLLSTEKNAMVGLGMALQAILGSSTCVAGLPCTQTTVASLNVVVGAGSIYTLANIDGTAYGSLAADTTDQIVKQGILLASQAVTLATPAPTTAGQSINYLIEAAYQDLDTTPVVLNFFNSANPQVPLVGVGGLGGTSNTQRKGTVVVQVKAGAPATTGSQTTPAPDSGFVGLYAVTVANGQTTVTSSNIAQLQGAPFLPETLGSPLVSHLAADFHSVSSTVLTDTGLSVPLGVGTYAIEVLLNFNGTTTGTQGLNLNTQNGTAVISNTAQGSAVGNIGGAQLNAQFAGIELLSAISVAPTPDVLILKYAVVITVAGTLKLQASQHTSSANASNILIGSYMTAKKV